MQLAKKTVYGLCEGRKLFFIYTVRNKFIPRRECDVAGIFKDKV